MKNVLVNNEKYKKLVQAVEYMSTCEQLRGCNQAQYKSILSMPDFVESVEDMRVIGDALIKEAEVDYTYEYHYWSPEQTEDLAQAAINTLKIKGE